MKRFNRVVLGMLYLWIMSFPSALAKNSNPALFEPFLGKYEGRSISNLAEDFSERDMNVDISRYEKDGFSVKWTTVIRYADSSKSAKHKTHVISFLPVNSQPGIYYAASKKDVFGRMAPADPFAGEPITWAGIDGTVLTISALYIRRDGGYEIQVYKRTLTNEGMYLKFERFRDGVKLRSITGTLEKH